MKRITFINRLALGSGTAILLPSVSLLHSCEYKPQVRTSLSEADVPLLNGIAETILPSTEEAPGAKAANVGEYMVLMYHDCMKPQHQALFLGGLNEIDARSANTFNNAFSEAGNNEKLQLLETLQAEAITYHLTQQGVDEAVPHFFDILKGLTISGYFSSEIGMTQARNYLPVPGKFEACIPYNKADRPWAM
jgi:hypothetical protein